MACAIPEAGCRKPGLSNPLDETIDHLFLAGFLKRNRQLVAVDFHHVAVAEFLVEHPIVQREFRHGAGGFRDQLAFDDHWPALAAGKAARRMVTRERIAARVRKW